MLLKKELRLKMVNIIRDAKEGRIQCSFSIVDILDYIYRNVLKINPKKPDDKNR